MSRFSLPLLSLLVLTPACDSDPSAQSDERSADAERDGDRHAALMVGMLCMKLDCSDGQEAELVAIARSAAPDQEQRDQRDASIRRFADAFRADVLDSDAIAKLHAPHVGDREFIRDTILAALGVLTGEQRDRLAELVGNFGPPPMVQRLMSDTGPALLAQHVAGRLCEVAECEGDQRAQIVTAVSQGVPRPSKDTIAAIKARVASVIRSDDLDADTVDDLVAAMQSKRAEFRPHMLDVISEVHAILSSEQRDAVATTLEHQGPRGLMDAPGLRGGL